MLQKKNYTAIAKILAKEQSKVKNEYYSDSIWKNTIGDCIIENIATNLASYFAENDCLFDRESFYIRTRKG